jgi:nitroreductase
MLAAKSRQVRHMSEIARLEVGRRRPDGSCEVAVVDAQGRRHKGVLTDPGLVGDYLDYLDSVGRDRPMVTSAAPAEPGNPALGPAQPGRPTVPIPASRLARLVATAARAPSVHNTQPWRFRASADTIELLADRSRKLPRIDPAGREMLISCGAALFGLRLGIRELGYQPDVMLLPDPAEPGLLARVRAGAAAPITASEKQMLTAMPHRHTHRGPFTADPLPRGLLAGLQHDAVAEGCTLALTDQPGRYQQLAALVAAADRQQHADPLVRAELRRWTIPQGSPARDGVPVHAYPAVSEPVAGKLAQRDFDLGRDLGRLAGGGSPPAATAILITPADSQADWLRAGQALHRLLLHAATRWVFASLHTQPLESPPIRAEVKARLALPGTPQMVLQLGRGDNAAATARRPADEILT